MIWSQDVAGLKHTFCCLETAAYAKQKLLSSCGHECQQSYFHLIMTRDGQLPEREWEIPKSQVGPADPEMVPIGRGVGGF